MDENEFIEFMVKGKVETRLGDIVRVPECFYKKGSGELNAEKIMMVVLKARSVRKANSPGMPVQEKSPGIPAKKENQGIPVK